MEGLLLVGLLLVLSWRCADAFNGLKRNVGRKMRLHGTAVDAVSECSDFLKEVALTKAPKRLNTLLSILDADPTEELV